jgi:hypothetical protein
VLNIPLQGASSGKHPANGTFRNEFMVNKILQLLSIRCSHKKLSQPFAAAVANGRRAVNSDWDMPAPAGQHYVVCLDCGHKFEYDWTNMRVIE